MVVRHQSCETCKHPPHHPACTRFFTIRVGIHYVHVMTNARVSLPDEQKTMEIFTIFSKYLPTDTVHIHRKGQRCSEPPKKVYFVESPGRSTKKDGGSWYPNRFLLVLLYINRMKFDRKKLRCNFLSFFPFSTKYTSTVSKRGLFNLTSNFTEDGGVFSFRRWKLIIWFGFHPCRISGR